LAPVTETSIGVALLLPQQHRDPVGRRRKDRWPVAVTAAG